jgi:hypothetical protein
LGGAKCLAGTFRKLSTFWGPFERFLFTDADVVLLDGFEKLFDAATTHAPSLQYAQYYSDLEQVYRPGRLRQMMVKDFHTHAINTGFWASRAGLFTMQRFRDLADEAIAIASEFCPTLEQPFMNYCLDMTRVEMRPFNVTGQECAWPGDFRPLCTEFGNGGRIRVGWADGNLAPAVHWAGYRLSSRMPYYGIYRHYAKAAMSARERVGLYRREFNESRAANLVRNVKQKCTNLMAKIRKTRP